MSMMDHAKDLPAWAAIAVSAFLVIGSVLTLIGAIGFAGMFCVFTYLAPTLVNVTGINERWMPVAVGLLVVILATQIMVPA